MLYCRQNHGVQPVKSINKILIALSGILFIAALGMSVRTIFNLTMFPENQRTTGTEADYHFAVFLPDNSYNFFQEVIQGARQAGDELNVALSFHQISSDTPDFAMARYTGIDGAIVYPSISEEDARRELRALTEADIPVVLIEHALSDRSPWPFVGTNSFDLGKKIGELAGSGDLADRGGPQPLQIAIVYSEKSPGILSEKELVEMGIRAALGKRLIEPLAGRITNLNPLDAENLTYQILRNEPAINTIIYTDTNDTLAATQVLIDMNLVGSVQIIGFGEDASILEHIEKGILAGTIAVHPFKIGYNAVKVLKDLAAEGHSAGFVDTGVRAITRSSLRSSRAAAGGGEAE